MIGTPRRARDQAATPTEPPPELPIAPGMSPLPALPALDTIDAVHAALGELDVQRLQAQQIVDAESGQEAQLLESDADDHEFAKLTMRTRQARRQLVRLARRERAILDVAETIEHDRRQVMWTQFRDAWTAKAKELHEAASRARELQSELDRINRAASRAGFGGRMSSAFPEPGGHVSWVVLLSPHDGAAAIPQRCPYDMPLAIGASMLIELVKPFGDMRLDALHRVPEARGRWLVEQGVARVVEHSPWGDRRPDPSLHETDALTEDGDS